MKLTDYSSRELNESINNLNRVKSKCGKWNELNHRYQRHLRITITLTRMCLN